jgi:hypothetical protein
MGTRSITEVKTRWEDKEFKTNAIIYRHWDGYLLGQGKDLFNFLDGLQVVNGISSNMPKKYANGGGRLAAQLITQMQLDGYDPDLLPNTEPVGQEYHYIVNITQSMDGGTIRVIVYDGPITFFGMGGENCTDKIFEGSVDEFGAFIKNQEDSEF